MWRWFSRGKTHEPETEATESEASEASPPHPAAARLLDLQRGMGNQAVQRLVRDRSPRGGGGAPLPETTREAMEEQFGEDFQDVRLHADDEASAAAAELGARAFTVGRDIYLAAGDVTRAVDDRRLLAHELAHVVQQSGGAAARADRGAGSDAEAEAGRAAERVAAGVPVDVTLTPAPAGAPARSPADWRTDVAAARRANDAPAMAALVNLALAPLKMKSTLAATSPGGAVTPADYRPLPDLNFDLHLNSKTSKPLGAGAATRSLSPNYGYSFTDGGKTYVVLGPKVLNEDSPIFTRMYAEHEMYHAAHHFGGAAASPAAPAPAPGPAPAPAPAAKASDQELEAWTHDFLSYFHQLRSFRPAWAPLIGYYETASEAAQKSALALLIAYHKAPPSPPIAAADLPDVQQAFEAWIRRRLGDPATAAKKLVKDLSSALGITASAPATPAAPAPAGPTPSPPAGSGEGRPEP
jgi:hypothetical protein